MSLGYRYPEEKERKPEQKGVEGNIQRRQSWPNAGVTKITRTFTHISPSIRDSHISMGPADSVIQAKPTL